MNNNYSAPDATATATTGNNFSLAELFLIVDEIHERIHAQHAAIDDFSLNFLTLTATGCYGSKKWTASFASLSAYGEEWYERDDVPFTAHGETAAEAVHLAATLAQAALLSKKQ